nr:glycosyltransferase [Curtobacterium pusillum]
MVRAAAVLIGATARVTIDRIAFASAAARDAYARLPFTAGIEQATTIELPRPAASRTEATPLTCVFVGVMEERKGVRELMGAWTTVETMLPGARLVMVGPGPLQAEAASWAAASPGSRHVVGRLPHAEATTILQAGTVLVAPSVPDGRWKEQIGLPIKEALAAGLTVVTTAQTGLAPWLAEHGHEVVGLDRPAFRGRLAFAIARALRAPLDRDAVRSTLPRRDGRLSADAWLHGAEPHLAGPAPTRPAEVVA